jgi:hypothetical protein
MVDENDLPKKHENNDRNDHGRDRENDRDKPPGQIFTRDPRTANPPCVGAS